MTQRFDAAGNLVVCTVIHAEPHVVAQVKTKESDGYTALRLGSGKIVVADPRTIEKRMTRPLLGQFRKLNIEPRRHQGEVRLEKVEEFQVGQELNLSHFAAVAFVDVYGVSKGKGFQGVIKRHNFAGGPGAHGSGFHRHGGSCGMRTSPGRTLPGQKKAGHMGSKNVCVQNLRVVHVDVEKNLLVVEGAIPGPCGALVRFAPAQKKMSKKKA